MKNKKNKQPAVKNALPSKILLEWRAPEYIQHDKGKKWYLAAGGIGIGCAVAALLTDNITLALAILVFGGVYYYMQKSQKPKHIDIRVSGMGIYAGDIFLPFGRIDAFWIIDAPGIKTLNLRITNRYHSDFVIQLGKQDPGAVRDVLISRIPEWEGKGESFTDILIRTLKF